MCNWAIRVSGRILVVLTLMLSGLPAWSNPSMAHAPGANAMAMMPGMPMDHPMAAGKQAPARPCCGDDGCCIAGSCALPMAPLPTGAVQRLALADDMIFKDAVASGITFPPSLRPPISD